MGELACDERLTEALKLAKDRPSPTSTAGSCGSPAPSSRCAGWPDSTRLPGGSARRAAAGIDREAIRADRRHPARSRVGTAGRRRDPAASRRFDTRENGLELKPAQAEALRASRRAAMGEAAQDAGTGRKNRSAAPGEIDSRHNSRILGFASCTWTLHSVHWPWQLGEQCAACRRFGASKARRRHRPRSSLYAAWKSFA